ncbi:MULTISPECIES: hypothetical protein [Amycolatopsis]|uniref:Uncharacterized protein n=2 Tax=Amycolatopsis TaxID=1813 RepID=A0A229S5A3_9PSEU|nr:MULTISPECIES: hypothetical protein [Amycolatopsis]AXB41311.1 hypothetical protein A4R43_01240 [Amycolatopsis albispora]OXM53784.1 hypothetical protein CFP71_21470 [Amycolatopsis thailandensis]
MSELWNYVFESAGWAVLGFLGGFLVGRAARDVHRVATAITSEEPVPDDQTSPRPRWRVPTGQFVLGVVVVLLGIITVAQGIVTNSTTRRITECQAAYSNGFADALDARASATADAQTALDELMKAISGYLASPPVPPDKVRAAIGDYLDSRERADAERQQHPYPPPPRDLCK